MNKAKDAVVSEIQQQLEVKKAECTQSDEVVREKSATIRAQQAEIQRLRDQLAMSQKVSSHTSISIHTCAASNLWL